MPAKGAPDLYRVDAIILDDDFGLRCSFCWKGFHTVNARKVAREHVRRHFAQGQIPNDDPQVAHDNEGKLKSEY